MLKVVSRFTRNGAGPMTRFIASAKKFEISTLFVAVSNSV
jgi:hypothetical protein